ncbi:MAG TPA: cytochrome c oxidase assembly protein [Burkholderiaceae bacterium]|nr:cytochrome c oxidase assembly protein [Burkholderiaceae bacterium]
MKSKLLFVAVCMFGFGYAFVPLYKAFCAATGINVLSVSEGYSNKWVNGGYEKNTQVDTSRSVMVEFDANVRGPWFFKPEISSVAVHPGELTTVVYEFQNKQNRPITAQAIPSYAPEQAGPNFHKIECFCFTQYTLAPGEKKSWPVVFVVDPKLSPDVKTITLSYTFFEVGGKVPPAPEARVVGSQTSSGLTLSQLAKLSELEIKL